MQTAGGAKALFAEHRGPLVVAILFFAVGLFWLSSSARYHGDERYYTDAALRMIDSGDAWTPMYADGTPRANKPLLTYWLVSASFLMSGISLFAARLPFLIVGACVVWLSGRFARVLFPDDSRLPLLTALIVACDVEIVTLSRRSTPDVILILFVTASLYGVARVVLRSDRTSAARAWFWLGGGLAIATKGGLGVLVLVFGVVCYGIARARGRDVGKLVHIGWCSVALLVAAAGLAPSLFLSAQAGGPSLFQDQIGGRLAGALSELPERMGKYTWSLTKNLLPWSLLSIIGLCTAREALRELWQRNRAALAMALGWTIVLWLLFSLSNTHRGRYLAPAHPILAAAVAAALVAVARTVAVRRTTAYLGLGLSLTGLVLCLALARIDPATSLAVGGVSLAFGVGAALVRDELAAARGLALAVLVLVGPARDALREQLDPSPLPAVAAELVRTGPTPLALGTVGLPPATASQLRLLSARRLDPQTFERGLPRSQEDAALILVAGEAVFSELGNAGYAVEPVARAAQNLEPAQALEWVLSGGAKHAGLTGGALIGIARPRPAYH